MISDKEKVKLPLRELGVRFVESHCDLSDYGSPQRLGRRTIEININAADLIREIAARAKREGRPLYIYHDGGNRDHRHPHPTEIVGIGFHIRHRDFPTDEGDFFVQPNGELSTFRGHDSLLGHAGIEDVSPKKFEKYLGHFLEWGDGEDEIKSAQSREVLDHITKGKER